MKSLFFCFVIIVGLNSCKFKDATVGAADEVVGNFTIKNLKDDKNNLNFPYTVKGVTLTGTIEIVKLGPSQVDVNMTLFQKSATGTDTNLQKEAKIDVKKSGSSYKFEKDGSSFGTLKGNTLTLEFTVNKETTTVTATKD